MKIKSFNADDLKKFHDKYFNSSNSFIIAVGDINKDDLKNKFIALGYKYLLLSLR